jgi:hypothetical protein
MKNEFSRSKGEKQGLARLKNEVFKSLPNGREQERKSS